MNKIFYDPNTLEIKGYSDGGITMDFPYVESEIEPRFMWNYTIEDGQLKIIRESFTAEEWDTIYKYGKL